LRVRLPEEQGIQWDEKILPLALFNCEAEDRPAPVVRKPGTGRAVTVTIAVDRLSDAR
jgi:hypothetical protein